MMHGDDEVESPSEQNGNIHEVEEEEEEAVGDDLPELPFVTTSSVLNQLNKSLTELANSNDPDVSLAGLSPRFELQKRLPDGSTVPASSSDVAYSDLKTKLEQSAKFATSLESDAERARWAERQRQVGNAYFQKAEYPAAMDIYLTCLVVKQDTPAFLQQTLLPVLNNLAQCTLQLGMHKKTMEFCHIALEELDKYPSLSSSPSSVVEEDNDDSSSCMRIRIVKCKIYYKRAKARRLTGLYGLAREDLNQASACLPTSHAEGDDDNSSSSESNVGPYRHAIQKEFRLVETAEKEARKNRQRQKQGMQKALSMTAPSTTITTATGENSTEESNGISRSSPLATQAPRKYSSLRARRKAQNSGIAPPHSSDDDNDDDATSYSRRKKLENKLSYFQYYCLVVARVAEALLIWMGDEETKQKVKERIG